MTATYDDSTGNGSNLNFNYTFPILQTEDVRVALNSIVQSKTKYTVNTSANPTRIEFNNNLIDSTLQESTGAPKNGISVRVFRETTVGKASGDDDPKAIYAAGSSIRAVDLNANTEQALYAIHELQDQEINGYEITSGTITAAGIADGAISDNHINSNAEIAVNKLQDGGPNQILHTAANGTDVEWTNNVDIPGTLDVTGTATFDGNLTTVGTTTTGLLNSGNATLSGTLDVVNTIGTTGGLLSNNVRVGFTGGNEIDTSTGDLLIDSAGGTTTVDDDLVVTGSITAPLWNGNHIDTFWLTNKQHINHIGETITLGKSSTGSGSSFQVNNAAHSFSVAKNYTFEVGRYVNEGVDLGTLSVVGYQPCFSVQHLINQSRVTKIGGSYSVTNTDESGSINLGTATASWIGTNTNLPHTNILHNYLVLSTRRGSNSGAITNPNSYCPNVVLHPTRGAMFTHPDNTAFSYSQGGSTYSALNQLAIGAYTQGTYNLGDPAGFGNNGYADASEALALFEPAVDFQIIVGGARVKNRFEIGSSSVAGTLVLSGVDITATASELSILSGVTANSSELNKLDGFNGSTQDLEEVVTGKTVEEQISGSSTNTQLPTALAVNNRIIELMTDVGGFHPIADEVSFPTTNVDINDGYGTIISIGNAAGLKVADGSSSGTYAGTAGNSIGATTTAGTAVTITGIDASLHGTTIAGKGMLVETTPTLNEYTYHRLVVDEAGVASAQAAIDDFDERYYGPHSANQATRPSGANRLNGDLYFNTSDGKMKVFNGVHATGTWDDVAAPGNFFINTLSLSSGSGGGSATFNNTATRFTLSNPPLTAQQLLVSINGVIQKPNSGTSPSEGFAIDGADIIFASAPATNAPHFIVTIGSSVNIGTPSNNTVGSAQIIDGSIDDTDISGTAAIAGTKISPDFGSQHVVTTGSLGSGNITVTSGTPTVIFSESDTNPDFQISGSGGVLRIEDVTNGYATRFAVNSDGHVDVTGNLDVGAGLDVTGDITSTGNLTITNTQPKIFLTDSNNTSDFSIQNENGNLNFYDETNTASRVRIISTGDVGIGTTSPSGPLHVYKSSGTSRSYYESGDSHTFIRLLGGSASNNSGIEFFSGSSANTANITALSTGSLVFDTGSTSNAVTIDTSGRLLIGNTTAANGGADDLVIEETGHSVGITLRTSTTANGNIYFADGTSGADEYRGFIQYLHATNKFNIGTNGTDKLTLDTNGHLNILGGNLSVASGNGIDFSAVSDGSRTVSSNLFNDYEVGEWTPVLQAYDFNNSNTYTNVTYDTALGETKGRYTKIGNIVHVWWYSSTFSLDSGYNNLSARISGLPFPKYNVAPYYGDNFSFVHTTCFKDLSGNLVQPAGGFMSPGNTWFYPILQNSTDTCRWGSEANRYIMLFGTYATSL